MNLIWVILSIACFGYYAVIALYAGPTADFSWFWIALGAGFLFLYLSGRGDVLPAAAGGRDSLQTGGQVHSAVSVLRVLLRYLILAVQCLIAVLSIPVFSNMNLPDPSACPYVIVLGAQVKGTQPSRALRKRLDKALAYAEEHPETVLVLSGGQGPNEDISEAECMHAYLKATGLDEGRMVLEDRSTSTKENLVFSDEKTGCGSGRCGILSNDFHVCRALLLAKKCGYADACGIDAPSDPVMQLHYIVRETAALTAEKLKGEI